MYIEYGKENDFCCCLWLFFVCLFIIKVVGKGKKCIRSSNLIQHKHKQKGGQGFRNVFFLWVFGIVCFWFWLTSSGLFQLKQSKRHCTQFYTISQFGL